MAPVETLGLFYALVGRMGGMNGPDYTSTIIVLAAVVLFVLPVVIALLIALPIIAYDRRKTRLRQEQHLAELSKARHEELSS